MNKTVNINLGGMFFHIDEDAYQKLTRYFEAIKRSLSSSNGQDEIIKDIEMRVSELLNDKQKSEKHVVGLKDVDEVIAVMGQPEDYRIDNDDDQPNQKTNFNSTSERGTKKLYRDKEGGLIGGVLSGLGYYFGIDKVWLRVILLIAIFFYGTGILAYIILWIVMPEAVSTSEKIEMKGEAVTISTIEKKVREEFDTVSEKFKNVDFDKVGNQVKSGADRVGSSFGDFILTILKIFAKFLGVILIMSSLTTLVLLFIGVFTLGTTSVIDLPWQGFIESGNFTDYPIWTFGILMFLAVGIPFFFLLLLGFKLVSPAIKSIGNIAKYALLAIWLIAVGLAISLGVKQATEFAVEGRVVQKEKLNINPTDTLFVKFKNNDYYSKNINDHHDFIITEDSTDTKMIYSNDVHITFLKTDEKTPYLQIDKQARGSSISKAKKTAEKIKYGYKLIGNQLILDNYLLTEFANKFRDQEVELYLYLPEGTLVKPDSSVQDYDNSDDSFFNLHFSSDDYIYKVNKTQVKCLNCPADENEWNDVSNEEEEDTTSTSVTLNENGILIKEKNKESVDKEVKSVKINKDGITIKTE